MGPGQWAWSYRVLSFEKILRARWSHGSKWNPIKIDAQTLPYLPLPPWRWRTRTPPRSTLGTQTHLIQVVHTPSTFWHPIAYVGSIWGDLRLPPEATRSGYIPGSAGSQLKIHHFGNVFWRKAILVLVSGKTAPKWLFARTHFQST